MERFSRLAIAFFVSVHHRRHRFPCNLYDISVYYNRYPIRLEPWMAKIYIGRPCRLMGIVLLSSVWKVDWHPALL